MSACAALETRGCEEVGANGKSTQGSIRRDLRNHNLSVTLDTLLRAQKPMSRADLAKETGLTKATLSLLASMLIESGVVQEGEPVVSTTYGRPSTPLEIRGGSIAGIGLQINTDGYGCWHSSERRHSGGSG